MQMECLSLETSSRWYQRYQDNTRNPVLCCPGLRGKGCAFKRTSWAWVQVLPLLPADSLTQASLTIWAQPFTFRDKHVGTSYIERISVRWQISKCFLNHAMGPI
jgi:hypothetical protein